MKTLSISEKAEFYGKKYKQYVDLLGKTPLGQTRSITEYDVYCLGEQLQNWEDQKAMCEEVGNVNLLGVLPKVAMNVITLSQGSQIANVIGSVQPLSSEQGLIYFKRTRAGDTRGNMTAGETMSDPRTNLKTGQGYASGLVVADGPTGDGVATNFAFSVPAPVKSESLTLFLSDVPTVQGLDIGPADSNTNLGRIFGSGVSGSVDYSTGAVVLDFAVAPAGTSIIKYEVKQNFELSADLPIVDSYFASKLVKAHVYALKGQFGMLQSHSMRKQFGKMADEEVAADLIRELNKEITGDLIRKVSNNAIGSTTFDRTPINAGTSAFDQRREIEQAIATTSATIAGNAGRGETNVIIAGRTMASTIGTMDKFKSVSDSSQIGPHVYGTLDGITIVRVNEAAILAPESGLALYNGPTPWESACVWAPYMALTSTGVLPESPNPLGSMQGAAAWGAVESIIPEFSTKLDFITS